MYSQKESFSTAVTLTTARIRKENPADDFSLRLYHRVSTTVKNNYKEKSLL